ncbi:MAG: hypothetical protein KME05_02240 [Gloeocapsa sp. UFS-A4-WI-NPMV-4B04]|nr:hypothetical protein [Gloeocapsa sp. UFS-A4-WI-NPMV-4B04]
MTTSSLMLHCGAFGAARTDLEAVITRRITEKFILLRKLKVRRCYDNTFKNLT